MFIANGQTMSHARASVNSDPRTVGPQKCVLCGASNVFLPVKLNNNSISNVHCNNCLHVVPMNSFKCMKTNSAPLK